MVSALTRSVRARNARGDEGALLEMAEVEWDHERFFRAKVEAHRLARWVPSSKALPPKPALGDGTGC